ncbi:hypothetical protein EDC94DRAFT_623260 [Helicostylum pulchrum]|nr:hypothetical protein EDC94DRAFT_623260 [Helicostylum pulchrum]
MATFTSTVRDLVINLLAIIINILFLPLTIWNCISVLIFKQERIIPNVVAITGASAGIGEELSYTYARDKRSLILIARNMERLEKVAEECKNLGSPDVKVVQMDVSDIKAVSSFFDEKTIEYGIDLFIANAGISHLNHLPIIDQAEQVFGTNLLGAVIGLNSVYKAYVKRGKGGQIACVSSIFGYANPPSVISYATSKAALLGYARDLRVMGKDHGITVNTIAPGFVKTAMVTDLNLDDRVCLTPQYFAAKVKYGLEYDEPLISLPLYQFFGFGIFSCLPPSSKLFIAQMLHKYADGEIEAKVESNLAKYNNKTQ